MRRICLLCLVVGLGVSSIRIFADELPTLESTSDKAALKAQIQKAQMHLATFKKGHVIVGQVVVEGNDNPEMVQSQMLILKGGYFAGPTNDLMGLVGFRMHQYEPYDLELNGKTGDIVDVGVIKMRRLPQADLVPIKGKLSLEGSNAPNLANVSLSVYSGPVNTPTNGTEPRPTWAEPAEIKVDPSGSFESKIFSPIKYYCMIRAKGYVTNEFPIELKPGVGADLGEIKLEKPRSAVLDFLVTSDGPFELKDLKKVTVSGGLRWKARDDIYGWDLEFKQKNGKLFMYHSYGPCSIADLGNAELKEYLDADEVAAKPFTNEMAIEDGNVYLINQGHWQRDILFKVKLTPTE